MKNGKLSEAFDILHRVENGEAVIEDGAPSYAFQWGGITQKTYENAKQTFAIAEQFLTKRGKLLKEYRSEIGRLGAAACNRKLTPQQRHVRARKAALIRWGDRK